MTRYVKQWDEFSCGPIAVLNARKRVGRRTTIQRDYRKLRELTGTWYVSLDDCGSWLKGLHRTIRSCEEIRARRTKNRTSRNVQRHLRKGGAAIVSVRALFRKDRGLEDHVMLAIGMSKSGKSVALVNRYPPIFPTVSWARRATFARYMKKRKQVGYRDPHVWLISKKK